MTSETPAPSEAKEEEAAPEEIAQEFRTGAQHLMASSANVFGTADIAGDVVAGNKIIHHYGSGRVLVNGPVPRKVLTELADRFAKPAGYQSLLDELRAERIVVLRGEASTGKRTAALSMLAEATDQNVVLLDSATTPGRLVEQLQPGIGHLVADPLLTANQPLCQSHVYAAREHLEKVGGYLIITIDDDAVIEESVTDVRAWRAPEGVDILLAHLRMRVESSVCTAAVELPETRRYLAAHPSPAEISGFAGVLVSYLNDETGVEDLTLYGANAAQQLARRRFTDLGCSLRDKAFLVALAVFDRSPYPMIAEAGDALYLAFEGREHPEQSAGLAVFGVDRRARLELAQAMEYDGWSDYVGRERLMCFRYPRTWPILLRYVWTEHPAAREPMAAWLFELADGGDPQARIRSAVAVGCLATAEFETVKEKFLNQWAQSDLLRDRQLAAWALAAAVDLGAEAKVRPLLRYWAEGSAAKRWTVVRTITSLADLLGKSSMPLLSRIARSTAKDGNLESELTRALSGMLTSPIARQTADTLVAWSAKDDDRRKLAQRAFLLASYTRHRDAPQLPACPKLLRLGSADASVRDQHTTLWRRVIDDPATRPDALRRLVEWVVMSDGNQEVEAELTILLRALAGTPNERSRVDYLLRHLPADASDSARSTAERLRQSLDQTSLINS